MEQREAQRFGEMLQKRRQALGLSAAELGRHVGVPASTITRLEAGDFKAPKPDKLAKVAQELQLSLADVFASVGYLVPDDLPSFLPYLKAKYPSLSEAARTELLRQFEVLSGISGDIALLNAEVENEGRKS